MPGYLIRPTEGGRRSVFQITSWVIVEQRMVKCPAMITWNEQVYNIAIIIDFHMIDNKINERI